MALPTLTKTWNFNVNNPSQGIPVSSGDARTKWSQTWLDLKDALKAISPGWTVAGSGGAGAGGGGGMDAVDRWVIASDITIAGTGTTSNSWIVLQNDNIQTGFQLLLSPQNTGGGWPGAFYTAVSPGGNFSGGTATTIPTASDSVVIRDASVNGDSFPEAPHWHLQMSADGEVTRWWMAWANSTRAYWEFALPANPISGWTNPWVGVAVYNSINNVPDYGDLANVDTYTSSSVGSTTMKMYWTSEGWNFDLSGSAAGQRMTFGNDLDNNAFPMAPVGLASETATVRGRHGELTDVWWGSTTVTTGGHYPDTLPRQFVQLGDIIVPWDQTVGGMLKS